MDVILPGSLFPDLPLYISRILCVIHDFLQVFQEVILTPALSESFQSFILGPDLGLNFHPIFSI